MNNNIYLEPKNITLWAFLNIENPIVAWEVAIGSIRSSCDQKKSPAVSSWFYNKIKNSDNGMFEKEVYLDSIRKTTQPNAVSRFDGLYFFKSRNDAIEAHKRMPLKINKDYLTEINFSANNYSEHDSMYITDKLEYELSSDSSDWMKSYWNGETLYKKPLIEVLASGIGVVINKELRKKAYWNIVNKNPYSHQLLNYFIADLTMNNHENTGQAIYSIDQHATMIVGEVLIDDYHMKNIKGNPLEDFWNRGYWLPEPQEKYLEDIKIPDMTNLFFNKKILDQ